jgi:hypothetical protein
VRLALHPESGASHEPRLLQHTRPAELDTPGDVQPQLIRASTGARRQKRAILDFPLRHAVVAPTCRPNMPLRRSPYGVLEREVRQARRAGAGGATGPAS